MLTLTQGLQPICSPCRCCCNLSAHSLASSSDRDNALNEGQQDSQIHPAPGAELTGCRPFNTGVIVGFSIAKAVCSDRGQAVISTTLNWVADAALALMYVFLPR